MRMFMGYTMMNTYMLSLSLSVSLSVCICTLFTLVFCSHDVLYCTVSVYHVYMCMDCAVILHYDARPLLFSLYLHLYLSVPIKGNIPKILLVCISSLLSVLKCLLSVYVSFRL